MTSWRETIAVAFGPGLFAGITWGDWWRMLRENRFAIHPRYWLRAAAISSCSLLNSIVAERERRQFDAEVERQVVQPPLFVLGHWRSGTTHLHNLLSQDERFAFPNVYETVFPHTFLSAERGVNYKLLQSFIPRKRPMDGMRLDLTVPWEDEYATCTVSATSPYMGPVFSKRLAHYDRYLTFRSASSEEIKRWRSSLTRLLKKLTYKYGRPLILKSPPHTCRIRLLLEMFPGAKFVHIHRNPVDVFRSTRRQTEAVLRWYALQRFPRSKIDDWIIRRYREMYDAFFEERSLIPEGCFHEIGFEDLEADPIATIQSVYDMLGLSEFARVAPRLDNYVESLDGYRKNVFAALPNRLRTRIAEQWQRSFREWGYPTHEQN